MTSKLRYSHLVDRMSEDKSDAWEIHFQVLARQAMGEKVLALTIGDSDYASAPIAIEAAVAALRAGKTRYSNILGEPETKATLARWYEAKSGLATSPDQVALTFGAQNAAFNSLLCLAPPWCRCPARRSRTFTWISTPWKRRSQRAAGQS